LLVDLIEGISWLGLLLVELHLDSEPLSDFFSLDSSVVDKHKWEAKGGAERCKKNKQLSKYALFVR